MAKTPEASREKRKLTTKGGLTRETAYLYDDEEKALEQRAKKERTSKSEIMRRALRAYLGLGVGG
jgi:Ribbon-helix-helix protein, copG family